MSTALPPPCQGPFPSGSFVVWLLVTKEFVHCSTFRANEQVESTVNPISLVVPWFHPACVFLLATKQQQPQKSRISRAAPSPVEHHLVGPLKVSFLGRGDVGGDIGDLDRSSQDFSAPFKSLVVSRLMPQKKNSTPKRVPSLLPPFR